MGYTSSVYCTASVLTLAAIALDRYHSIMDCLRYNSRCTLWRTCSVVLWIWLQALTTSCPPLLGWSSVSYVAPMFSCAVNWDSSPSYTAFMAALSFLLPAAVILFCYVNIVKVARGHARRIHNLEDYLQRSRQASTASSELPSERDSTVEHCGNHHGPSRLVYHLSGQFVSEVRGDGSSLDPALSGSGAPQASSNPTPRSFFSFLAHGASTDPQQNSSQQQQHNHHGIVRLFLVILAFFLCWTPYVGVALVQATETILSGKSSLVSPTAITFSYWLVLLNSDINPVLYALLSKRFQGALQNLRQKIRARLERVVGRAGEGRTDRDEGRSSDIGTQTSTHPDRCSIAESSGHDESKYCSSIFTVNTSFKHHAKEHVCGVFLPGSSSSSSSSCRVDCLQVPSHTQEGSRLPFSAATKERQATFFYGQITVRVEHDVC